MSQTFALVDCNNFYASCERLFRPDLTTTPIVVLSNNDGCIVARSQEAKQLGIKMGTPLFKVKDLLAHHKVKVFSSNYTLYGDISQRVMQTLETLAPHIEIYSIDEAFLDLHGMQDAAAHGQTIRATVLKNVGVPVCVGIAPTKTLAKLANYAAKKYKATNGVVDLRNPQRQLKLMALTPVDEVWGIGRRLAKKLGYHGIHTALDLAQMNTRSARSRYSVVLERTIRELNGESCQPLEQVRAARQQIICSRSFGTKMTDKEEVRQAVCEFVSRAAEKLRRDRRLAGRAHVFIRTSPYYSNMATGTVLHPSDDTRDLLPLATELFDQIWKDGFRYAKAGVMLSDTCSPQALQQNLFSTPRNDALMATLDKVNNSGKGKIWFGSQRPRKDWFMTQENLSPAYTTRWKDLPVVR
ncbi:MAG: DNA polymerase V subunit UmuC [Desulfuromonas sp.]|nr:MAG: DNA polymerase V subunit UmuC [Desulfuromonas sp.]